MITHLGPSSQRPGRWLAACRAVRTRGVEAALRMAGAQTLLHLLRHGAPESPAAALHGEGSAMVNQHGEYIAMIVICC